MKKNPPRPAAKKAAAKKASDKAKSERHIKKLVGAFGLGAVVLMAGVAGLPKLREGFNHMLRYRRVQLHYAKMRKEHPEYFKRQSTHSSRKAHQTRRNMSDPAPFPVKLKKLKKVRFEE